MAMPQAELIARIREIQNDASLNDAEKAKKRQDLMSGKFAAKPAEDDKENSKAEDAAAAKGGKGANKRGAKGKEAAAASGGDEEGGSSIFDETLQCAFCCNLCERPVTAPCQHNFCLKCFQKWVGTGKKTCPTCRAGFPAAFASNPRINTALTIAIRMAKLGESRSSNPSKAYARVDDKDRPDEAFVTDRAVRAGRANASSGRIMVTVPNDHFGPIPAENDPRGQGIRVGEWWKDRLDCRQWGAHFPHVAGIAGQSNTGAQSVVLSGGYEDDRDEGEWFLYTGSGGRDLSGNKRTSKVQSFDQKFENMNKALKLSCTKGLPVRVVRSYKEKRSAYAPSTDTPVRYDGIYRIIKCWRKPGAQKYLICRYLFVRCDNEPAPWSTEETGDKPGFPLPPEALKELKQAQGAVFEMGSDPWWGWDEDKQTWGWTRDAPISQRQGGAGGETKRLRKKASEQERALREFACGVCKGVVTNPMSTPCGHAFCKGCLDKQFEGLGDEQAVASGRSLRVRKTLKPCPTCKVDIAEFLKTAQVNWEMGAVISKLQEAVAKAREEADKLAAEEGGQGDGEEEEAGQANSGGEEDGEEQEEEVTGEGAAGAAAAGTKEGKVEEASGQVGGSEQRTGKEEEKAAKAEPMEQDGSKDKEAKEQLEEGPAAAVAAVPPPQQQQQQAAPVGGATAGEIAALAVDFPEYDEALIRGMVEDQGGDVEEVRYCLKRMKNQQAAAERRAKNPTAAGSKKKKGGGRKAAAAGKKRAAPEEEKEEEEEGGTSAAPEEVAAAEELQEEPTAGGSGSKSESDDDFVDVKKAKAAAGVGTKKKPVKRTRRN